MPYEIKTRKYPGTDKPDEYDVINKDTGETKATHATKEKAEAQVRLLEAIENDPGWE